MKFASWRRRLEHGARWRRWFHMPKPRTDKKPSAPSDTEEAADDLKVQIASEIYVALERLSADEDFPAVVGSWGDMLSDAEALSMLREYNETGRVQHPPR